MTNQDTKQIERFDIGFWNTPAGRIGAMNESPEGKYVLYSDYEQLAAELEKAREVKDNLIKFLQDNIKYLGSAECKGEMKIARPILSDLLRCLITGDNPNNLI